MVTNGFKEGAIMSEQGTSSGYLNPDKVKSDIAEAIETRTEGVVKEAKFEIKHPILIRLAVIGLIVISVFNAFLSYQAWQQNQRLDKLTRQLNKVENLVKPKPGNKTSQLNQLKHK